MNFSDPSEMDPCKQKQILWFLFKNKSKSFLKHQHGEEVDVMCETFYKHHLRSPCQSANLTEIDPKESKTIWEEVSFMFLFLEIDIQLRLESFISQLHCNIEKTKKYILITNFKP